MSKTIKFIKSSYLLEITTMILFLIFIGKSSILNDCDCNGDGPDPADPDANSKQMTFELLVGSYDAAGCNTLNPSVIQELEVQVVTMDGTGDAEPIGDPQHPTLNWDNQINVDVPEKGIFGIDIFVVTNCDMCCNYEWRDGVPPVGCGEDDQDLNEKGMPVFEDLGQYEYSEDKITYIVVSFTKCLCYCD